MDRPTREWTDPGRPTDVEALAQLFRALAEPSRLRILCHLMDRDLTEKELVVRLRVQQPRVSRHLHYLKRHGFVRLERTGMCVTCSLDRGSERVKSICDWIRASEGLAGVAMEAVPARSSSRRRNPRRAG